MNNFVFNFKSKKTKKLKNPKDILGGKGSNLVEMRKLNIPVPPGFTITTDVCAYYYDNGNSFPDDLSDLVNQYLTSIEKSVGCTFGDPHNPLLVSVRSGSRASMPGMMDTVLNLGLNDVTVEGLAIRSADVRFAYDSYRRFIQMFGDVVLGIEHYLFEEVLDNIKLESGVALDTEL